jgi:hypothetical protein
MLEQRAVTCRNQVHAVVHVGFRSFVRLIALICERGLQYK